VNKVSLRIKSKASTQEQIEKKKEKLFLSFKWNMLHDDSLRSELKKEMNTFAEMLLSKFKKADSS
jgi:hypothetical protein